MKFPGWKALSRRPLVLLALATGAGYLARLSLGAAFLPLAAALAGSLLLRRGGILPWVPASGLLAGALLVGPGPQAAPVPPLPPLEPGPRLITLEGSLLSPPLQDPLGGLTFRLRTRRGWTRLLWRRPTFLPGRGDRIRARGVFRPPPASARKTYPGRFLTTGVNLILLERAPWWSLPARLDRLRLALRLRLTRTLSRRARSVALCLLLGDPSSLDPWEEMLFRRTGTAHLLVVSGLHVALVAWFILRLAGGRGTWLPFLAVVFYAFLSGGRPPALRAALGFGLWRAGRRWGRKTDLAGVLAGAALPLLLLDPAQILGASFQVSYAAVAAMGLLGPPLGEALGRLGLPRPWVTTLAYSTAATLGAGPVSLARFGTFSPWSLLLTPLLTPLLGVEVFLSGGALLFPGPAGALLEILHGGLLSFLSRADRLLPATPLHPLWAPPGWILLAAAGGAVFLLLALPHKARPAAWALLFLPFFLPVGSGPPRRPWGLLLSVGHGQCLVLELPGLGVVVHDAGSLRSPRGTARRLLAVLRNRGRRKIDLLALSHADRDHVAALPWILGAIPVDRILLPEHPKSRALAKKMARSGIRPRFLPQGGSLALPLRGGRILLAAPGGIPQGRKPLRPGRPNERGLVLHVRLPRWSLLSPGDLSGQGMDRLLAFPEEFRARILLAPHHGARTGKEKALVRAFRPRIILASRSRAQGTPPAARIYRRLGVPLLWTGAAGPIPLVPLRGAERPTSSPPSPPGSTSP